MPGYEITGRREISARQDDRGIREERGFLQRRQYLIAHLADGARAVGRIRSRFGESNGECMAFGRRATPEPTLRMGVGHQDGLRNQIVGGRISGLNGVPRSDWLSWGKLSLEAYPSGVQMGNCGRREGEGAEHENPWNHMDSMGGGFRRELAVDSARGRRGWQEAGHDLHNSGAIPSRQFAPLDAAKWQDIRRWRRGDGREYYLRYQRG